MNMFSWVVGALNRLEILILKLNFQKSKVISGKTPFFVISPLLFVFLYENVALSITVLPTKKLYYSFLEKVSVSATKIK